jgi:hypothetical protein
VRPSLATIAAGALVLLLAPAVRVSAQSEDPLAVVNAYIAALNAHDFDAALALFAEGAVVRVVPAPRGSAHAGVFAGEDQIRLYLHRHVFPSVHVEVGSFHILGDKATCTAQVSDDSLRARGVAPVEARIEVVVAGGKIRSLTTTLPSRPAPAEDATTLPRTGGGPVPALASLAMGALLLALGLAVRRAR